MAKIFKRGRSKYYQAEFYDHAGTRRYKSTKCTDKRAAEIAARRFEREAQNPVDSTEKEKTSLEQALIAMLDHLEELQGAGRRSSGTLHMHTVKAGHILRVFEVDLTGNRETFYLDELKSKDVDRYISRRRSEDASENTISKELITLRLMLKTALRQGLWEGEPESILPTRFAPEYKPVERYLSKDEFLDLVSVMTADHAARTAFAVATSANRGETFRAMRADISGDLVRIRGTKRSSRLRTVPIVLDWQRELIKYATTHAKGEDGKLFRYDEGFQDALKRACKDAKIPHVTSNDLRRTFCHWARQSGAPRDLVAAAMGHGSTMMIDRVYGKLDANELGTLLAKATGGRFESAANMQQQNADTLDTMDALHDRIPRKSLKWCRGRDSNPHAATRQGILSPFGSIPNPREYLRNRSYDQKSAANMQQEKAVAGGGIVLVFPKGSG